MTIEQVQRWVISALICAVSAFPLGALAAAVHYRADDDPAGAVLLTVMMGSLGVAAATVARLVHGRSPWSPYAALGIVPAIVSTAWTWA